MYFGRLPKSETPKREAFERGSWSSAELEGPQVEAGGAPTRRAVLVGLVALGSWTTLTWFAGRASVDAREAEARGGSKAEPTLPPAPPWHEEMLRLPADELLGQAGEFERKSRRAPQTRAIEPGFRRLLAVASASRSEIADAASACALRTLAKIGRGDLVAAWARGAPAGFEEARREAEYIVETARAEAARRARLENESDGR